MSFFLCADLFFFFFSGLYFLSMSHLKELTHTLQIVLDKLDQCDTQQREIINKVKLLIVFDCSRKIKALQMSTKRTLLQSSHQVLQNQYGTSLCQDWTGEKRKVPTQRDKQLVSILGDTVTQTNFSEPGTKLNLIKSQAWIRGERVWIQAQGVVV